MKAAPLVAIALLLLVAGAALYAPFVGHVLGRGEGIVKESLKSPAARQPLILAAGAIVAFWLSGLVALAPPVRSRRFGPLAGLGLPLAGGAVVGLGAFSLGRAALLLGCVTAAPSLLTCILACLTPPRPSPGLARFVLRSWMATGFLAGLALAAVGGLSLATRALPRIPWSSLLAALAVGTLLQLAARYVTQHGAVAVGIATDHVQARRVQDTPAIRDVAERLHPFIERGANQDEYARLAVQLGAAVRQPVPPPESAPAGMACLPPALAWLAALLRAAAVAAPLALLVPRAGWAAAAVAAGIVLPLARSAVAARGDRAPVLAWTLGGLLAGTGGWLGLEALALPAPWPAAGAVLALPGLSVAAARLRRKAPPSDLAHQRLLQARSLQARWLRDALASLAVAGGALVLPLLLRPLAGLVELGPLTLSWRIGLAFAVAGTAWAASAALTGPAAAGHRARLEAQAGAALQQRANAHRTFLERLELT